MDLIDGVSNLINFGIDLKLTSRDAELFYTEALRLWFENNKGYDAFVITDREFTLSMGKGDIASVFIYDSILRIKPVEDDPYEILICLLEFIAEHHTKTIEVFNYLEENGQEIVSWPKDDFYNEKEIEEDEKKSSKKKIEDLETEDEDSDEWI